MALTLSPSGSIAGGTSVQNTGALFQLVAPNVLNFQTNVLKDSPSINKNANFARIPILNRSSDIVTYINSGNMTLDITLELLAFHDQADQQTIQDAQQAYFALLYPIQSGIEGPVLCEITLGNDPLIQNWPCVCTKVSRVFVMDAGWDDGNARVLAINLSFLEIEDDSSDASDISSGEITFTDPDYMNYDSTSNPGTITDALWQAQTQYNQVISALSQLGVTVNQNGITFNPSQLIGQSASSAGLNLGLLGVGGGLPGVGGSRTINF